MRKNLLLFIRTNSQVIVSTMIIIVLGGISGCGSGNNELTHTKISPKSFLQSYYSAVENRSYSQILEKIDSGVYEETERILKAHKLLMHKSACLSKLVTRKFGIQKTDAFEQGLILPFDRLFNGYLLLYPNKFIKKLKVVPVTKNVFAIKHNQNILAIILRCRNGWKVCPFNTLVFVEELQDYAKMLLDLNEYCDNVVDGIENGKITKRNIDRVLSGDWPPLSGEGDTSKPKLKEMEMPIQ